jgi:hypothetical protein
MSQPATAHAHHITAATLEHPIAKLPDPKVVQRVQHDPDGVKPKVKIRAHLACISIAIFLTIVVPHVLHSEVFAAITVWFPNVAQETIDRILHL